VEAPRYGPGRLLTDGADECLRRTAKLAFRPSARQETALLDLLGVCAEVYNAGLQERRDAWRRGRKRVRLFDQFKQITQLRVVRDDALAWGVQPLRSTLRRLDEAYSAEKYPPVRHRLLAPVPRSFLLFRLRPRGPRRPERCGEHRHPRPGSRDGLESSWVTPARPVPTRTRPPQGGRWHRPSR